MSDKLTLRDIAQEIDWLGGSGDVVEFDQVNWSTVTEDGVVKLYGYADIDGEKYDIGVDLKIEQVRAAPVWEEEEDEDEDRCEDCDSTSDALRTDDSGTILCPACWTAEEA